MQDYLSQLNSQQRQAVEYMGGPQLVIAGAGSGKTRVLTYKIVHLLAHGYEPYRIMALTFTNKAAREMRERISAMAGEGVARDARANRAAGRWRRGIKTVDGYIPLDFRAHTPQPCRPDRVQAIVYHL